MRTLASRWHRSVTVILAAACGATLAATSVDSGLRAGEEAFLAENHVATDKMMVGMSARPNR